MAKNAYLVSSRNGRNIRADEVAALAQVEKFLFERGVIVLGTLWAKAPKHRNFFTTAFQSGVKESIAPFGCVRVSLLNNGEVRFRVMGLETDHGKYHGSEAKIVWKA